MDAPLAELQLEALLSEVRFDYDALRPAVQSAVEAVQDVLDCIPEKEIPITLAKGFLDDVGVSKDKSALVFKKPESLTLIGSYCTHTMAKPHAVVDLAIRIPKGCFYEKDFLNHRYHAKRALYLAFICKHLRKSSCFKSVEWSFFQQDGRKPVLTAHLASGEFVIRLFTTISSNVFDLSKLDQTRNNVREKTEGSSLPTPNYNASILEDMFVEERSALENNLLIDFKSLKEAIILIKVWLRQRSCYNNTDCLNGFLVSMLMLHLATDGGGNRITRHMTALQIFRITLEVIATQDLLGKGIRLQLQGSVKKPALKVEGFGVVFLDTIGNFNVSFRMTRSALKEVKHAAERTLAAMKAASGDNGFHEAFMTIVDFPAKFDYHISVQIDEDLTPPLYLNDGKWRSSEEKAEHVLSTALNDRATLIHAVRRNFLSGWNPKMGVKGFMVAKLHIGVLLSDYDTAFRMIDVGPSADKKEESAKFRSFWGKRAELRRFKDGTICEAVGWECEPWNRHLIIPRISKYILARHIMVSEDKIEVVSDQLDFSLLDKTEDPVAITPKILKALEVFTNRLKALHLPLKISTVQPISAAFRHAAVFPPRPRSVTNGSVHLPKGVFMEPLEVMIQLEGSGRWPNDQVAIKKTKAAFCLKIADSVQKQWKAHSVASEDAVDILMDGFAFRILLFYEKDFTLIRHKDDINPGVISLRPRDDIILRSMHSSMLYGLHGRFPAYGHTVRLAKRWIAAHLFSDVLAEEATELLVAYIFLRPEPMSPPCTRITGFLRFLRLLAAYDWKFSPLIVDINGDLSLKDRENIVTFFKAARKGQHSLYGDSRDGPAMFLAASYDTRSLTWTRFSPSKPTLKRLMAYAKSSGALLSNNIRGADSKWPSIFRTPLECYDVVILLQRKSLLYPGRVLFPAELSTPAAVTCPPVQTPLAFQINQVVVGFNPVLEFVEELKSKFGDSFDVWYDAFGSDVIGLTLRSRATEVPGSKRKRTEMKSTAKEIALLGKEFVYKIFLPSN